MAERRRPERAAAAAFGPAAGWLTGYAVAQLVLAGSAEGLLYLSNVAYNVPILVAVVLCVRAAVRTSGRRRPFWALIALFSVLWLCGELAWAWYELVLRTEVPFPALPDVFYIVSYLPCLTGLVLVFRGAGILRQWRALLDASIITLVVGTVGWQLLVGPRLSSGITAASVVASLPPLLDLATVVVIGTLGFAAHRRLPGPLLTVMLAFCAFAVSDGVYTYLELADSRGYPKLLDLGWQAAAVLIAVGAALDGTGPAPGRDSDQRDGDQRESDQRDSGLPLVLVGVGITLAAMVLDTTDHQIQLWTRWLAVYVVLAVIVRLLLTSGDKDRVSRQLAGALAEQRRLAVTDGLTGLYNRRFVEEMLQLETARALRNGGRLGVMVIDVDHFKAVNDSYGHQAGDEVLHSIAERLGGVVRRTDVVGRYGGEEFVVIVPDTDAEAPAELAERCRRVIAGRPFPLPDGPPVAISVSVGVAVLPEHASTARELVRTADRALYLAKSAGRDRVQVGADDVAAVAVALDPAAGPAPALPMLDRAADLVELVEAGSHRGPAAGRAGQVAAAMGLPERTRWTCALAEQLAGAAVGRRRPQRAGTAHRGGGTGPDARPEARILAVCDAWRDLAGDRGQDGGRDGGRDGAGAEGRRRARQALRDGAGSRWDPEVVRVFLELEAADGADGRQRLDAAGR